MMKNVLALTLILGSLTLPQRTSAAIGVLIGAPVTMAVLGLVPQCYLNNTPLCGFEQAFEKKSNRSFRDRVLILFPYLVSLDGDQSKVQFGHLERGIPGATHEEIAIYNSELDQLNAVLDLVTEEVKDVENATELWNTYGAELNPATLSVARALIKN